MVLDSPARRSTLPYGIESEKRGKLEIEQSSPLVGDHNRFSRNMIVNVEIIAGRMMCDALTKQGPKDVNLLKC